MSKLLEDIAGRFTGRLHGRIRCMKEFKHASLNDNTRIGKLLIFYSLENCREFFETPERKRAFCRFSIGQPKKEFEALVQKMEEKLRGRNFLKKGVKNLSEYLVDFSFSNLTIDQALGHEEMPPGRENEKFELLMAAESEGDKDDKGILKDFMKLIDVKAPVKVMIFQAREGKLRDALRDKFKEVLLRHSKYHRDKSVESQWLFIGTPGYRDWMNQWKNPGGLPKQIEILDVAGNEPAFVNKSDWWSWEIGPVADYKMDYEE
jgi:hypothetical protein